MLRFHNGRFKIMQVADIQDTQCTSPDTLRFIAAAIDKEKPDLVVFSGDQVKSYGHNIKKGNPILNMQQTVCNILAPLSQRDTPFTYVFGNHDATNAAEKQAEAAVYEAYPNCANRFAFSRFQGNEGICLPVSEEKSDDPQFMLYLLDTHGNNNGLYDGVTDAQLQWMKETDLAVKQQYGYAPPAILFQHIPLYEMYEILKEVPKGTFGAIEGNNSHRTRYYTVTQQMKNRGEYMLENIACPKTQNAEFETLLSMENMVAAFFGHDHNNCFTGRLKGIEMGYTPGVGFHVYGPGFKRGVRIIECLEEEPFFTTKMLTYQSIFGTSVSEKAKCTLYNHAPSSRDEVITIVKKAAVAASAVSAFLTLCRLLKTK